MVTKYSCTVLLASLFCFQANAQQAPCQIDVPANVILPDCALVRHLAPSGFLAGSHGQTIPIESLNEDSGPRRVIFIPETGKRVTPAARRLETVIFSEIVAHARSEDSFALLTANGPRHQMDFGAGLPDLKEAIEQLAKAPKGKGQVGGALDAVIESLDWFGKPQPGDAIVVAAMTIEDDNVVHFSKVRSALEERSVRLFCYQLGDILFKYYGAGILYGPGLARFPSEAVTAHKENAFALSSDTGGFMLFENTTEEFPMGYKLTDDRIRVVSHLADQISGAINEYYRVRIEHPDRELSIELVGAIHDKLSHALITFPHYPGGCSPAAKGATP